VVGECSPGLLFFLSISCTFGFVLFVGFVCGVGFLEYCCYWLLFVKQKEWEIIHTIANNNNFPKKPTPQTKPTNKT
jgi:hypothetical protein